MTIVFVKTKTNKKNPTEAPGKLEKHSIGELPHRRLQPRSPHHSLVGRLSGNVRPYAERIIQLYLIHELSATGQSPGQFASLCPIRGCHPPRGGLSVGVWGTVVSPTGGQVGAGAVCVKRQSPTEAVSNLGGLKGNPIFRK